MPKVQRSIRLSPDCDEALRVMAERDNRSVSQLIDQMVRMQFIGWPGERSQDGRENAQTKAAREKGLVSPQVLQERIAAQQAPSNYELPKFAPRRQG